MMITDVFKKSEDFKQIKKNRNIKTYKAYDSTLKYFLYYLREIKKVTDLNDANKEQLLQEYQTALIKGFDYKGKPIKFNSNTINTHIRRIKTFMRFIGYPIANLRYLDTNKASYKALDIYDIRILIKECDCYFKNKEIAVRTKTLIKFLFNTALRIDEALKLKVNDVYEEDDCYYINIHEKGKPKDCITKLSISHNTYDLIQDYIKIKAIPSSFIFTSSKKNHDDHPISSNVFNKNMLDLTQYVDDKYNTNLMRVIKGNSSHYLRHSKAIYLLHDKNIDITEVKDVLRHKNINNTMIYLNQDERVINNIRINNDI